MLTSVIILAYKQTVYTVWLKEIYKRTVSTQIRPDLGPHCSRNRDIFFKKLTQTIFGLGLVAKDFLNHFFFQKSFRNFELKIGPRLDPFVVGSLLS